MKKYFDSIFSQIPSKTFQKLVVLGSFIGDLTFIIFCRSVLFTKKTLPTYIEKNDVSGRYTSMPLRGQRDLVDLMLLSVDIMILSFVVLHIIIYTLYLRNNQWSAKYIKNGVGLFGILFSIFTFIEAWPLSKIWAFGLLALTPIYIFIFQGMRHPSASSK